MLTTVPCPVHPGEVLLASVQVQDLNPIAIHWTWQHMSCVCFSLAKLQYTNWDTYVGPTQTTPMRNCREGYLSSLSAYAVASAKSIIWKKNNKKHMIFPSNPKKIRQVKPDQNSGA
jgi:hypothetical protein